MFHWASPTRKNAKRSLVCRQRTTLHVEALEGRDCPSAPQITAFAATVQTGNVVLLSGTIIDAHPTAALVCFGGAASGSVTPDASGHFQLQESLPQLGTVFATVKDPGGITSTTAQAAAIDIPPVIVNFRAINNGNNCWTFTGQVQDEDAAGLVVTLRGLPSLNNNNASATVQANGSFSYTITLQPGESGGVTAVCIDEWGQASNAAMAFVWS
jgi:hypothetical protein